MDLQESGQSPSGFACSPQYPLANLGEWHPGHIPVVVESFVGTFAIMNFPRMSATEFSRLRRELVRLRPMIVVKHDDLAAAESGNPPGAAKNIRTMEDLKSAIRAASSTGRECHGPDT